jgi:hypothetical protein
VRGGSTRALNPRHHSLTPRISYYSPSINLTGNHKHATKNADGRVDGNHSTIYTSTDILAHPSVQLTRGGLILIGLLSGGDYHAGLSRCGPGIAHGLAKCGFGDELLEATQSLTRAELPEFLARWREGLRNELRTNSRGRLVSKKPSLAKIIPDSFPDIDVLLSYTNPITSATDAGARRTHTPPRWDREPDLAKIGHLCELHFEWGLKDIIIKRFRTVLWPSIVLRALRRSALEKDTKTVAQPPRMTGSHQDVLGTPSKLLARHFSFMALRADNEDDDSDLRDLIVKIHSSRMHAYTDGILEYRLEVAPAQLVRLASAGIQGLRKPADTTYDVLPSDSEDSDEGDDEGARGGANGKKKRRGNGPPPEPDSHLRMWMPECMVRHVLPDIVEQYETALEAKRAKKSRLKAPRDTARAPPVAKRKGKSAIPSKKTVEAPPAPADEECFDLNVSSSEESDGRTSPLPSRNHLRPLPAPLPAALPKKSNAAVVHGMNDVFADDGMPPKDGVREHSTRIEEHPQQILDIISYDDDNDDTPGLLKMPKPHLASPSKVLQSLDLNHHTGINGNSCSKAQPPVTPPTPSSSLSHVLRPFPIAFEEEESSESDREPSDKLPTSIGHDYAQHRRHTAPTATPPPSTPRQSRLQRRALPVAREEEEESSDDPDAVPAGLPVLLHPPTLGQSGSSAAVYTYNNMPLSSPSASPKHDASSPKERPSRQQSSSLSPSKACRRGPQRLTQPLRRSPQATASATDDDNDGFPDDRRWRRVADTSIISISSDSDGDGGDSGDVRELGNLLAPVPPLLIARSRTAEQNRLVTATAATASYLKAGVEPEIIDLT